MKITIKELKSIIRKQISEELDPDKLSDEDVLHNTEPKYFGDMFTPEHKLLYRIFLSKELKLRGKSPEEIAAKLGVQDDQELVSTIKDIISNSFYNDNPNNPIF